jgi:hypothetical protein
MDYVCCLTPPSFLMDIQQLKRYMSPHPGCVATGKKYCQHTDVNHYLIKVFMGRQEKIPHHHFPGHIKGCQQQ